MDARGLAVLFAALVFPSVAMAEEPSRPPLPESLLTESATDVDATEAGELELEANFASVRAAKGGAHASLVSLEAEWRLLKEFGLRVEPTYSRTTQRGKTTDDFGASGALALGLFHDFAHDRHVQAELHARATSDSDAATFDPSDSVQPISADLVSAMRLGRLTLRGALGVEAGGRFEHVPFHADVTAITGIVPDARFGFVALEVRTDWARRNPLVLAPEVVADTTPIGLPVRLGIALPFNIGAADSRESYGFFVRFIVLTDREAEFVGTGRR